MITSYDYSTFEYIAMQEKRMQLRLAMARLDDDGGSVRPQKKGLQNVIAHFFTRK